MAAVFLNIVSDSEQCIIEKCTLTEGVRAEVGGNTCHLLLMVTLML